MRPLFLSVLAILAACNDSASEPPPATSPTATPAAASTATAAPAPEASETPAGEVIASEARLAGEYRVAGVGGGDINLPYGITASISANRIHITADCVNAEWSYRLEDGVLATERVPTEGCARGLTAEEEALFAAFDGADKVLHLPSGAYEFIGRGPQATLFTQ